jgi:hypothetical protein
MKILSFFVFLKARYEKKIIFWYSPSGATILPIVLAQPVYC